MTNVAALCQCPNSTWARSVKSFQPGKTMFSYIRTPSRLCKQQIVCSSTMSEGSASTASLFSADRRPIILFDGVCNLCNGGVRFALDNDPHGSLRFAALQSDTGRKLLQRCGRRPDDISSIVLVEPNSCHIKSEAILRIAKYLKQPFPALAQALFPLPGVFRDLVYDQIAGSRYDIFGKTEMCQLTHDSHADRFLA